MARRLFDYTIPEIIALTLLIGMLCFTGWYIIHSNNVAMAIYRAISQTAQKDTIFLTKKQPVINLPPTKQPTGSSTVNVTDSDNGKTIIVHRNQTLVITLGSTYWSIGNASNAHVLKMVGTPTYNPDKNCVPGGGCGTVTAQFAPLATGTATISASRNSCGEAMGCLGSAGSFAVTITVE